MSAEKLMDELLAMADEDLRVREELAQDGSLYGGYHPRMREVHERNAARLRQILDEHGWPGRSLVGEQAAEAAWLIVQHAIGDPPLQRHSLVLLRDAAAAGEAPVLQAAMLEDRIRTFEGRGQLYGTQFDWDEEGAMSPFPIEDVDHVDAYRRQIGLPPLEDETRRRRRIVAQTAERPPQDWAAYQREMEEWLRSIGWR
ncbi:MAG: DUF6624 domain-containing protein [Thermoanaerobaculia bacterium]